MEKPDFKVIYNLTKNFNENEFKNIIKNINDQNNIKEIVNKYGQEQVINLIQKIQNFHNKFESDSESSEEYNITGGSEESLILSDTSSEFLEDTTPTLSETTFNTEFKKENQDILDIVNEINEIENFDKEDSIDNLIDNLDKNLKDANQLNSQLENNSEFNILNFLN